MGACEFWTSAKGPVMEDAYYVAYCEAKDECGHGGYTGTIAETSGVVQEVASPMTQTGATWYSNVAAHKKDKWGPAYALPVAADEHFNFKTVKLTVTLPGVRQVRRDWADRVDEVITTEHDLRQHAEEQVLAEYGHRVHSVEVDTKLKTKLVAEPAKGKPVLRYEVPGRGLVGVGKGLFDTKAQAVAHAKKNLRAGDKMAIRAVRYWPESDTTDAVVVSAVTDTAVAVVAVTLATPKKGLPPVSGWQFFGVASC